MVPADWRSERGWAALDWLMHDMRRCPYVPENRIDDYLFLTAVRLDGHDGDLPEPNFAPTLAERKVLQLVSCGIPPTEVHSYLGLSYETVKTQLETARRKMHAISSGHAACMALRRGLIE